MEWCVDLGNTTAKVACFDSGSITEEHSFFMDQQEILFEWIGKQPRADACIVSNVGKDNPVLYAALRSSSARFMEFDEQTPIPVIIEYETPRTLGKDRLAALVGAITLFPATDVLVIDAGTAITIDLLTADGHFRGGVISPGLTTRFRSLHQFTARLPMGSIVPPVAYPAVNTQDAVNAGVVQGAIYELEAYIRHCSALYPSLKVLGTGGDAIFFADQLKNCIFVVPKLVYTGLHRILHYNASC